jgi:hypothetical protein
MRDPYAFPDEGLRRNPERKWIGWFLSLGIPAPHVQPYVGVVEEFGFSALLAFRYAGAEVGRKIVRMVALAITKDGSVSYESYIGCGETYGLQTSRSMKTYS